jgi:hypothetical protein
VAALADQERGDLRPVEDRSPAHRQPDPRPDEEAAEDGREELVGGDIREVDGRQADSQPDDRRRAADSERPAELTVTEGDDGRLRTRMSQESGRLSTSVRSIETPVTPPSMKRLDRRKPWRPIPAARMPERMYTALTSSLRWRFMGER